MPKTMDPHELTRQLREKVALQFADDATFLRCIELLTTVVDPGVTLEVVAPRMVVLSEWHAARCYEAGLQPGRVGRLQSLGDLPDAEAQAVVARVLADTQRRYRRGPAASRRARQAS